MVEPENREAQRIGGEHHRPSVSEHLLKFDTPHGDRRLRKQNHEALDFPLSIWLYLENLECTRIEVTLYHRRNFSRTRSLFLFIQL